MWPRGEEEEGGGVGVPCDDVLTKSTLSRRSCAHLVPPPSLSPLLHSPSTHPPLLSPGSVTRFEVATHSRKFFPETLFPTLIPHSRHGSQQQQQQQQQWYLQIPPPGASRPHGSLRTHRDSCRPCLDNQGQPGHHVRRAAQRRHHQRPFPGHDRAVLHLRLRGRHALAGHGRGGRGAGAGGHHGHRYSSLPGSVSPPRPHRHHTQEVHRLLK